MGLIAFTLGLSALTDSRLTPFAAIAARVKGQTSAVHRGLELKSDYQILQRIPHDPNAFTQGLVWDQGALLEGTGLYGKSQLRKVNASDGAIEYEHNIGEQYFGEGIAMVDDKIVQLTWKHRVALVYNKADLRQTGQFTYTTETNEGWGITTDGKQLIVSDGSSYLFFWDKDTYKELRRVQVKDGLGRPVDQLNELEYGKGFIWANVWLSNYILQIDPESGKIVNFYDFSALFPDRDRKSVDQVLNGIAYDAQNDVFYLTGKWWPEYFKTKIGSI